MSHADFAARLLAWHDRHGRHDLPWQREPTPYRVWISEIMLQQTQVSTVIPYFERFTARFPDVATLAAAQTEDVLALWSGLGYYARARNLHAAACRICEIHHGALPNDIESMQTLPGIGRSTAAAILALSRGQRHPILDGNVKRVLARHAAVEGWPGGARVQQQLWNIAECLTPHERAAQYTQAIMDLGALVCLRAQPRCVLCPVAQDCEARSRGLTGRLPQPRPRRDLPERETVMALVCDVERGVLLERRPPQGIWGGLYSLPEFAGEPDCRDWIGTQFGRGARSTETLGALMHTFTHFRLRIVPVWAVLDHASMRVMEGDRWLWYKEGPHARGLPAPVRRLISTVWFKRE
jgi:A/G-specific adenine glycosylase